MPLCCSDCVGIGVNVCCIAAVVEDRVSFSHGVLKYTCIVDVMDVVFSVCIVMHRTVGDRIWEV